MKIFWAFKSIPELEKMPKKEAQKFWRRCRSRALRRWQVWLAVISIGAACGVLAGILLLLKVNRLVSFAISSGLTGFAGAQCIIVATIKQARRYLNPNQQAHCADDSSTRN